jgi:hypothetical protein
LVFTWCSQTLPCLCICFNSQDYSSETSKITHQNLMIQLPHRYENHCYYSSSNRFNHICTCYWNKCTNRARFGGMYLRQENLYIYSLFICVCELVWISSRCIPNCCNLRFLISLLLSKMVLSNLIICASATDSLDVISSKLQQLENQIIALKNQTNSTILQPTMQPLINPVPPQPIHLQQQAPPHPCVVMFWCLTSRCRMLFNGWVTAIQLLLSLRNYASFRSCDCVYLVCRQDFVFVAP